jgi:ribose transport system substrate-binding protein
VAAGGILSGLAVGSSASLAATAGRSSARTHQTSSDVSQAQAAVQALSRQNVPFPFPTTSVRPGRHHIAIVAAGLAAFGTETLSTYLQQAVQAVGWTAPPTYDGQFLPTVQSGLIEQAVQNGAQALILEAINPNAVSNAIALANSKKIPIVCINCGPLTPKGMINVEMSPQKTGTAQADYVIAQSNGTAKVWVYDDMEFAESALQIKTAVGVLQAKCPGCQVHEVQMLTANVRQPGIPVFSSVLSANPTGSIDWVLTYSDTAALPFATLAQQEGRTEIKFIGFQAAPTYVAAMAAGNPAGAQASIAIPIPFFAYAAMDELARTFRGQQLWRASQLPVGIIDKSDLSRFDLSQPFIRPGFNFIARFEKLWGRPSSS